MFEGIVSSVLVKVLGDYIENLDANSLNIGILSGKVELRNLFLKPTALDSFDLPVSVVKGTVGYIMAEIPWKSLGSSPVIARVSDVFLVVQPRRCNVWDSGIEAQRRAASQRSRLSTFEAQLKKEAEEEQKKLKQQQQNESDKKSGGDDGFVSRLTETVINNLQVHINNVHVRYEDPSDPDPSNTVVFGVTLKSLSAVSCDENWVHSFIKKAGSEMRKKVELREFCVYMANYSNGQSPLALLSSIPSSKAFQEIMLQMIHQLKNREMDRDVLVDHIDGTLKLVIQKDGESLDLQKPKIAADLEVGDVNISLHKTQYRSLLRTLDYVSNYQKLERYRRWRPAIRPAQEPKQNEAPIDYYKVRREWWSFALKAGKDQVEKRYFSWDQVRSRKKQSEDYIALYKKKKKLDKSEQKRKQELEDTMDTKLLIFSRELAEGELKLMAENKKKIESKSEPKPKSSGGWFSSWLGGGKNNEEEEDDSAYTLTDEQRKFLHTTIGYDAQAKAEKSKLPNDYEKLKLRFRLRGGIIQLKDNKQAIVSADYHNLTADVTMREAEGNIIACVGLESFNITDQYCQDTKYPNILSKRATSKAITSPDSEKTDKLIDIRVETAPLHGQSDLEVGVILGKTDVVINTVLLQKILSFFIIPATVNLQFVQQAAKRGLDSIQQQALTQLRVALEDKKLLDVSVQIRAPRFIIPKDCNDEMSEIVVIDFGKFHIKSDIDKEARKKRIKEQAVEEKDFYDRYNFELKDVKVLIVPDQGAMADKELMTQNPLLHNVTVGMQLSQCITSHPSYPSTKITGKIPKIQLVLSPKKFDTVLFTISKVMDLIDNPTGTSSAKLALGGVLRAKQIVSDSKLPDIKEWAINDKFKEYNAELRQDGRLFFFDPNPEFKTNRKKPAACILLSSHLIKLLDGADIEKDGVTPDDLVLRMPQPDGEDLYVVLNPDPSQKLDWKAKISNTLLSYATYDLVKSSVSTDVVIVDHSHKPNSNKLKLDILLEEFSLLVNFADPTNKESTEEKPLARLDLQRLNVEMMGRSFDQQIRITLKTLGIEYLPEQMDVTSKYILHSSGNEHTGDIAELKLIMCSDDRSEHFALNADTFLSLQFATFKLFFDPLAISKFVLFAYSLVDVLHNNSSKNFRMLSLTSSLPDVEKQIHEHKTAERSSIRIDTKMQEMSLILRDSSTTFATASMCETSVNFSSGESGMFVSGDIGNLVAEDKSGDMLPEYSEILGLGRVGSSVVKFSFEQNKNLGSNLQYGKVLRIVMQSVKGIYLNRFVSKLQLYFSDGPLLEALKEGGRRIKDITTDAVMKQTATTTAADMLGLDLTFETPIVKVPVSCTSRDHIYAELGRIRVFNVLSRPTSTSLVEDIRIELQNMNMKTKLFGAIRPVVDSVNIDMSVKRLVYGESQDTPSIDFDMSVSEVAMKLSQAQYQMIFRMIDQNINDSITNIRHKSSPKPEPITPPQEDAVSNLQIIHKLKSLVNIKFSQLNLTLFRGVGGGGLEKEDPIARLNMHQLLVIVSSFEGKTTTKVKLHKVDAFDMRNDSLSHFKKFIDFTNQNTDFIEVDIETRSSTDADRLQVDVKMGDPRVVFEPQIVAEIQNFFTNMRPGETEKTQITAAQSQQNEEKGDLHFSTNTWLGNDLTISDDRKLYIDANQSGEVVIDGAGNTIKFVANSSDTTGLIVIAPGMRLRLRNIVLLLPDNRTIVDMIKLMDVSSSFVAPATLGVFRDYYNPAISESDVVSTVETSAPVAKKQVQDIRVKLGHPSVVFPVDATKADTNLFVVKAELDLRMVFTDNNRAIEVAIRDLTAYSESAVLARVGSPIIEPIHMNIKVNENTKEFKRTVNASIKGVLKIRLAYQDVKMITQVVEAFKQTSEISSELSKNQPTMAIEQDKTEDSATEDLSDTSDHEEDDDDDQFEEVEETVVAPAPTVSTVPAQTHVPQQPETPKTPKEMDVTGQFSLNKFEHEPSNTATDLSSCDEITEPKPKEKAREMTQEFIVDPNQQISILIVDDLKGYDIPLLNFVLSELNLMKAFIEGAKMNFKVSLCLYASYYNMGLADWEPIIEPWRALVDFERALSSNPNTPEKTVDAIHIKDIAKGETGEKEEPTGVPLNFNFTQSMIQSVITTSQLWKDEFSGKSVSKKVEPYLIRNHSGFNIQMVRGGYETISLLPRKEHGFNFEKNHNLDFGREEITIAFPDIQLYRKIVIDVRKNGLSRIIGKDGLLFGMVEVELVEGRKIITVRSGIKIKNHSTKTWLVGSGDLDTQSLLVFGEVKPGQDVGVPMNVVHSGTLCIRPKDSAKKESPYWWSDAMPGFKFTELMLMENRSRPVECREKSRKSNNIDAFCAVIRPIFTNPMTRELEKATKDNKDNAHYLQRRNCIIEIRAPLCIENLLGCDMMISVREKDKLDAHESRSLHKSEHKLVKMGKKIHLYRASMRSHILLKAFPANNGTWTSRTSALIYLNPAAMSTSKERIPVNSQWQILDEKRRPLKIHFDYSRSQGTAFREVMLYVPFWIMNHTERPLLIRELHDISAGQEQTKSEKTKPMQPISPTPNKKGDEEEKLSVEQYQDDLLMFSFMHDGPEELEKQKIAIKLSDTQYSEFFRIEKVGVSGNLSLSKSQRYSIGFHTSLCPGKFARTKLVTFYSRYMIVNKTENDLVFKQEGKQTEYRVKKNERIPFYWNELDILEPKLQVNIAESSLLRWSAPFSLNTLDEMYVKLNGCYLNPSEIPAPSGHILSVNITEQQGCILVTVKEPMEPPYLIDNELECDIIVNQIESKQFWSIPSHSKVAYAWDSLSGKQQLSFQFLGCAPKNLDVNEVTLKPIFWQVQNAKDRSQSRQVKVTVSAQGPTRVVRICDARSAEANGKEKKKDEEELTFLLDTKLSGIGLSLIDNYPREICYVSISHIRFRQSTSDNHMYLEFKCLGVQIDNMLREAAFPVAFAPVNKHTYAESSNDNSLSKPFLHFSMCKSTKESNDSINLFRYLSFNLQEATIEIDYTFIENVINLVDELTAEDKSGRMDVSEINDKDIVAVADMLKIVVDTSAESNLKYYFEAFELHPVRVNLTFKFTQLGQDEMDENSQSLKGRLYNMMKSLGFLTNIDDAPICLNALLLRHPLMTKEALQDRIMKHYTRCGTYELYKIVGSLELIGNPVGLFNDLTTGVKDLFYEPASALTRSPEEFYSGLAKGSLSLLSHSIHGTFNTASKITGTIGKGVSMLTLDDQYVMRRERNTARKARGVKEGLLDGTEALAKGIFEGAVGVIAQPVKGAKNEGFFGAMKGIGKGIIGLPTKPISGIVDFASKTTEGISNIGTVHVERKRKPRTFRNDGLLTLYSEQDAFAADLLYEVNEGSYMRKSNQITIQSNIEPERSLYYMPNRDESSIFLITNRSVMKIKVQSKTIQWIVDAKQIKAVKTGASDEIIITYSEGSKDQEQRMYYKDADYRKRFKEHLLSVQQAQFGK